MLVQPTKDEGATLERPSKPQSTPSPPHPSEANVEPQFDPSPRPSPSTHIPDSIPESSGGNHGGQSSSDKSLSGNEGDMTLQSVFDLCISLCTQQRLARKKSLKKNWMQKESVSKQGRKSAKAEPSVHKDPLFDELDDDEIDNMETEDAQGMGRTRYVVHEEKERKEKEVSTKDVVSTDKEKVSTDRSRVSTDKQIVSTDKEKDSTDKQRDSADRPDEGTVDQDDERTKAVSREKEKGVELKDVEETERPRPTSTRSLLTLKPLLKIDPKDKGKKKIEEEDESDTKSEGIPEAEKKFKQLAHDEEITRKMQKDWETEEERKRLAEEVTNAALIQNFDDIKAIIEADRLLALRLQEEERAVHSLYEKVKRFDETFTVVGSIKDERKIKEMNERAKYLEQKRLKKKVAKETPKKEDTAKVPAKVDVTEQGTKKRKGGHMKMLARKRKRPRPDVDSNDEHKKCLKIITFEGTIDCEIMERKSVIARLNKVSSPDGDYLVIYRANGNFGAFNYLMEILHIFDTQDLFHLYDLVLEQYSEITLEGFELILWGNIKIMMESSTEENDQSDFWSDQQDWKIVTWRLYEACGVYILELEDRTVIHMLVERRVFNSPCFMVKSWLVQDQTVLGKDYSNLLIADSLLKTIWFINAPCYGNEALASPKANELTIPEQTATGKGKSNPFMAGSLPKTTKPT
ncbi:hypothetical protein Tco_0725710 [Tanacetum coccineum]|uniref:Uncharacterized protein n=2 Tax=Tanacetum coccineum TaxID=301880 RepID=A0ABQ4YDQ0_9ASTR